MDNLEALFILAKKETHLDVPLSHTQISACTQAFQERANQEILLPKCHPVPLQDEPSFQLATIRAILKDLSDDIKSEFSVDLNKLELFFIDLLINTPNIKYTSMPPNLIKDILFFVGKDLSFKLRIGGSDAFVNVWNLLWVKYYLSNQA